MLDSLLMTSLDTDVSCFVLVDSCIYLVHTSLLPEQWLSTSHPLALSTSHGFVMVASKTYAPVLSRIVHRLRHDSFQNLQICFLHYILVALL